MHKFPPFCKRFIVPVRSHMAGEDLVDDLISSAGCWLIKRILKPYVVTKNKFVRAVRPKADNGWQVGVG